MQLRQFLALAIAGRVFAQDNGTPSLEAALGSQNSTLSVLNGLLRSQPALTSALNEARNITILAPSNDALNAFLNSSEVKDMVAADPGVVTALLSYHVLNGTYFASNFTDKPMFIHTMLTNETYANVTGGQVVEAVARDDKVFFYSGLRENSSVATPNVNFTGGTIHVIDRVLTLPPNDTATLVAANLTAAEGAITKAKLGDTLDHERDLTIFVPNNGAFNAIGSLAGNLSEEQLTAILGYHVIKGTVAYSTAVMNGSSVETLNGEKVTFTVDNGTVYVNSAKVVAPDVLVSNGVVHVIDNVLNPSNSTAKPDTSASSQVPAFSGASTATSGGVPFTSGVATPTSTAPVATQASSTSSGLGVPMKTGAVGAAALFGGAAMFVNL